MAATVFARQCGACSARTEHRTFDVPGPGQRPRSRFVIRTLDTGRKPLDAPISICRYPGVRESGQGGRACGMDSVSICTRAWTHLWRGFRSQGIAYGHPGHAVRAVALPHQQGSSLVLEWSTKVRLLVAQLKHRHTTILEAILINRLPPICSSATGCQWEYPNPAPTYSLQGTIQRTLCPLLRLGLCLPKTSATQDCLKPRAIQTR